MDGKDIQKPSLHVTHLIHDVQQTNIPSTDQSDIEKAFYEIIYAFMIQALVAFGFPELLIQALKIMLL
jgi:hypothetical protein